MPDIDFDAIKAQVDMVELCGRYTELKKVGKEFHGPCPFCGGDDRFHVFADRKGCHCRKCDRQWDCFDLIAQRDNCSKVEAAKKLGGDSPLADHVRVSREAKPDEAPAPSWRDPEWQEKSDRFLTLCRSGINAASGKPGRDYLTERGLSSSTIAEFEIGFTSSMKDARGGNDRPAIVIPWRRPMGELVGIKWRFVDEIAATDKKRRYSSKRGSELILFGANHCKAAETLVAIEGEINCCSVYQAALGKDLDVVSMGSEGVIEGFQAVGEFAKEVAYKRLLVWCDDAERSMKAGRVISEAGGIEPVMMQSPHGLDANDILCQKGAEVLYGLIKRMLQGPSQGSGPNLTTICRDQIAALYAVADERIRRKLMRLDSLLLEPNRAKGSEAIDLADDICLWCHGSTEEYLEGAALVQKVQELFSADRRQCA